MRISRLRIPCYLIELPALRLAMRSSWAYRGVSKSAFGLGAEFKPENRVSCGLMDSFGGFGASGLHVFVSPADGFDRFLEILPFPNPVGLYDPA